jgi:hypothetical protein
VGPTALDLPASLPLERDLAAFAVATALDACVNETLAVLVASEAQAQATNEQVRAVLDEVIRDEARHAELAWRTLRWAVDRGGSAVKRAVARALDGFDPLSLAGPPVELAVPAHGLLDGRSRREALLRGWREVVAPCLAGLLADDAAQQQPTV